MATGGKREVVFSGMRPTGRLHIGNYWGALRNWVELTRDYDCFYAVADWHMLTTGYDDTGRLQEDVREMVLDWLAGGLDPQKCVIFRQSHVSEHAELALLLGMVTPLSWCENNPTWKEQLQELARTKHSALHEGAAKAKGGKVGTVVKAAQAPRNEEDVSAVPGRSPYGQAPVELRTFGFLGYPVLQAADILLYKGARVPVGQDQLPHLELSREIARRFNQFFGEVFPEPRPLLTQTPRIPGTDGRKMSKSYGNTVDIFETGDSLKAKVMGMYTDPKKIRANDPGHPEPCPDNPPGCSVYALHKLYSGHWEKRGDECRKGEIGCVACKKDLLGSMEKPYAEFRSNRERFSSDPGLVDRILDEGARKARAVAQKTMDEARRAMRLT